MFKRPVGDFLRYTLVVMAACGTITLSGGARGDRTLDEVRQGTLLLEKPETPGRYDPAPMQQTHAQILVTGPIARALVKQRFLNPGTGWAEAIYAFPLPEDAAVDRLRMRLGDRILEGRIEEKEAARQTYAAAAREGRQASLLEQHRPNLFTAAVGNIPPHGEITVEIEYQHRLGWRDGAFSLRFPMAITPRYQPGSAGTLAQQVAVHGGWAILPGELANAVEMVPPTAGDQAPLLNPVTLEVVLQAGFPLESVESRYHAVDRSEGDDGAIHLRLRDGAVAAERDFELVWRPQAGQAPVAAFFTEPGDAEAHYGLLMVMPPAAAFSQQGLRAREILLVVDTSGSMGGASIRQAREALGFALQRLRPEDRFNLIEFDSTSRALYARPVTASPQNIQHAMDFVASLEAGGGTEMLSALTLALGMPASAGDYLRQILFITDGAVGNEAALMELIHRRLGDRRLFTVGIGSAPSSHFMIEAAYHGRGSFTFIGDPAEVGEKMGALFARIEHPALTDLHLVLPEATDRLPDPLPDLYLGEPVVVAMKLTALPERGRLEGHLGNLRWTSDLILKQSQSQEGLGTHWARERIRQWQRALARGEAAEVVREAVLALALRHHLVSPYTSLVAVDQTPVRPPEDSLASHALPNHRPAGWQPPARSVRPTSQGGEQLAMAAGATSFPGWLMAGIGLLLAAGLLGIRRRTEAP